MKKKFETILLCVVLFIGFSVTTSAIDTPNVVARLIPSLTVAYSESTSGTHKFFGGTNSASSKHDVYFEAQRSSGDKWVTDTRYMVAKGGSIDNKITSHTGSTVLWRLELNPYGVATKNCTATGYMWYRM